jgi:hypothetical protein
VTFQVVYRSQDPRVIGAWRQSEAALAVYTAQVELVLRGYALHEYRTVRGTQGWRQGEFLGLSIQPWEPVPPGWRMAARLAEPDKSTPRGRRIAAAIAAVQHPGDPVEAIPGMPANVIVGDDIHWPTISLLERGTALYASWDVDPAEACDSFMARFRPVDATTWSRVGPSRYCAAVRAARVPRPGYTS